MQISISTHKICYLQQLSWVELANAINEKGKPKQVPDSGGRNCLSYIILLAREQKNVSAAP